MLNWERRNNKKFSYVHRSSNISGNNEHNGISIGYIRSCDEEHKYPMHLYPLLSKLPLSTDFYINRLLNKY
jgi:hypothetical protein